MCRLGRCALGIKIVPLLRPHLAPSHKRRSRRWRRNATALRPRRAVEHGSLDGSQQIILLGKLIFNDRELSVRRNEACAFCHMPETGFTGPVSALNLTTSPLTALSVSFHRRIVDLVTRMSPPRHPFVTAIPWAGVVIEIKGLRGNQSGARIAASHDKGSAKGEQSGH